MSNAYPRIKLNLDPRPFIIAWAKFKHTIQPTFDHEENSNRQDWFFYFLILLYTSLRLCHKGFFSNKRRLDWLIDWLTKRPTTLTKWPTTLTKWPTTLTKWPTLLQGSQTISEISSEIIASSEARFRPLKSILEFNPVTRMRCKGCCRVGGLIQNRVNRVLYDCVLQ